MSVLGGRGGSGKSWLTGPHGPIDRSKTIVIDSDEFKKQLGFHGWDAPLYHAEASDLVEGAAKIAKRMGLNVTFDLTMRTPAGITKKVETFENSGYKVHGYYMYASPEVAATRATKRFMSSGRYVPAEYTLHSTDNEKNFDELIPRFDHWAVYDNNAAGDSPKQIAVSET